MADAIDSRSEERELLLKAQAGVREAPMVAFVKLQELRLLKLQNQMIDCTYDAFPALQAEARTLSKLIKEFKPKVI